MKPYAQIATLAELEQAQRRSTRRLAEQSRKAPPYCSGWRPNG